MTMQVWPQDSDLEQQETRTPSAEESAAIRRRSIVFDDIGRSALRPQYTPTGPCLALLEIVAAALILAAIICCVSAVINLRGVSW